VSTKLHAKGCLRGKAIFLLSSAITTGTSPVGCYCERQQAVCDNCDPCTCAEIVRSEADAARSNAEAESRGKAEATRLGLFSRALVGEAKADPLTDPARRRAYYGEGVADSPEPKPSRRACAGCDGTGGASDGRLCTPCRGSGSVRI